MRRDRLFADPTNRTVHDLVLDSCSRHSDRTALIDASCEPHRKFTYGEYGALVESLAKGFVASGVRPGDVIAIYLPNSWEFAAAYHATTLAGAIPTPLNPSYREREVRYQLENSGAVALITDGSLITGMNLSGLAALRNVYCTRTQADGCRRFDELFAPTTASLPPIQADTKRLLAALPYSSGTTGLPKGVMLTHSNLVSNVYQVLETPEHPTFGHNDVVLGFLPLYHIYGLNVLFNPVISTGATLVLMPRFDTQRAIELIQHCGVTIVMLVPLVMNAFCQAVEKGIFPRQHTVRWVKCGAAPLAPELPRRFTELTGILVRQGYGMTEASPVTHMGFVEPELYRPESIGPPVALTDCLILDDNDTPVGEGDIGELVMRGPQFMRGYWKSPEATAAALRPVRTRNDGEWYFSGDVARRDKDDFYYIVDRRKEMLKYNGFPIAPAEVEAVLLEHAAVRDAGVVGRKDDACGDVPCAFIVLRDGGPGSTRLEDELRDFVAQKLTKYKAPREIHFVSNVPRNPSGKILRRELRDLL